VVVGAAVVVGEEVVIVGAAVVVGEAVVVTAVHVGGPPVHLSLFAGRGQEKWFV
jgi:hypothetical protein